MANILILGAGSMGTAFSFPCSDKNHAVTIVGTHLEDLFIDNLNRNKKKTYEDYGNILLKLNQHYKALEYIKKGTGFIKFTQKDFEII